MILLRVAVQLHKISSLVCHLQQERTCQRIAVHGNTIMHNTLPVIGCVCATLMNGR
jgi:hypothetical protein